MTNQVKVPKEIQELFFEAKAFFNLADAHKCWLIPSPKSFYYTLRAEKVNALAWRALRQTFPAIDMLDWIYDVTAGVAKAPVVDKPKAPRVPRKTTAKTSAGAPTA